MGSARTGEYSRWVQLGLENTEDELSRDCRIKRMDSASAGEYRGWVQPGLENIEDGFS